MPDRKFSLIAVGSLWGALGSLSAGEPCGANVPDSRKAATTQLTNQTLPKGGRARHCFGSSTWRPGQASCFGRDRLWLSKGGFLASAAIQKAFESYNEAWADSALLNGPGPKTQHVPGTMTGSGSNGVRLSYGHAGQILFVEKEAQL